MSKSDLITKIRLARHDKGRGTSDEETQRLFRKSTGELRELLKEERTTVHPDHVELDLTA